MASLEQILYKVNIVSVAGNLSTEVNDLQIDSRKVNPGTCFIAIKGTLANGHQFINVAIAKGASAIICEELPTEINENAQYIVVENSSIAAGIIANGFTRANII